MKKLLISFNETEFNYEVGSLNSLKNKLEKMIGLFNSMDVRPFEPENLNALILDTEAFLYKRMMAGKSTEYAGINFKKEEFFKMMEKPPAYFVLISETKKIAADLEEQSKKLSESAFRSCSVERILRFFQFDTAGSISVKQEILDTLKSKFEVYIDKPEAIFAFKTAEKIASEMNNAEVLKGKTDFYQLKRVLDKIIDSLEIKKGRFEVNVNKIKYFV